MRVIFVVSLLLFSINISAQDSSSIIVHKDPRLDLLVKKHMEINEITTRNARRFVQGYRILVMNTNDRTKAIDAKSQMYREFPELKSYLIFQAPFYKLKLGNFKERTEAEEYLDDLKRFFQQAIYVVRDIIEVNPDRSAEFQ